MAAAAVVAATMAAAATQRRTYIHHHGLPGRSTSFQLSHPPSTRHQSGSGAELDSQGRPAWRSPCRRRRAPCASTPAHLLPFKGWTERGMTHVAKGVRESGIAPLHRHDPHSGCAATSPWCIQRLRRSLAHGFVWHSTPSVSYSYSRSFVVMCSCSFLSPCVYVFVCGVFVSAFAVAILHDVNGM